MRDQRTFENFSRTPLRIGYSGENAVAGVDIDLSSVLADGWGATLLFRRYGEENVYEAQNKELEGSILHVTFTSVDAHVEGRGEATIQLMDGGGAVRKSATTVTVVEHALDLTGEAPEPPSAYRTAAQQDAIDAGKLSKSAQAEKTEAMTQPVGVDADGKLWALPGGGGGSSDMAWLPSVDASGNLSWTKSDTDTPPEPRNITGPQGQDGADGAPGPAGPQGIQGPAGADGADGEDGITPTIGNNGNWYLGSTDTGKPSRGEQGQQGIQGPAGADGLTTSVTVNGETFTQSGGNIDIGTVLRQHQSLAAYRTSAAQDAIDATKADKSTIKTAMDSVATVNTQYFLGTQSAVNITLPSTGINLGSEFLVVFTSGATAATLTCDLTGFDFTPKANKTSWLKFTCYDATNGDWLVETKEG